MSHRARVRQRLALYKLAFGREIGEFGQMLRLVGQFGRGRRLSGDQWKQVRDQLGDLARLIPAFGIFMLPGGSILLPLAARLFPWGLLPSAFREKGGVFDRF